MIRWVYPANDTALRTRAGRRSERGIEVARTLPAGLALAGPGIDMPAGRLAARIVLDGPARGAARLTIVAGGKIVAAATVRLSRVADHRIALAATLAQGATALEVRLHCRGRVRMRIVRLELDLLPDLSDRSLDPDRKVGFESRKSYAAKIESGFLARYLSGPAVLEIGYKGYEGGTVPIMPQAIGVDVGYPGYDGARFPFADDSFDAIYSSHCYEHVPNWKQVLQDWHRILRPGGFLVIVVPHQHLFERKCHPPSPINPEHKRFYTGASLLREIEQALPARSYRIRHMADNDASFDYGLRPYQGTDGSYEIELVVEKLALRRWSPDDDAIRPYAAGEFITRQHGLGDFGPHPWAMPLDLSRPPSCEVWGPYVGLGRGDYEAEFYFEFSEEAQAAKPAIVVDVGEYGEQIAVKSIIHDQADIIFRSGRVTVPFSNEKEQGIMEFRVYVFGEGSPARAVFNGVVVRMADARPPAIAP